MRPLLSETRTDAAGKLDALGAGQFSATREGGVIKGLAARWPKDGRRLTSRFCV